MTNRRYFHQVVILLAVAALAACAPGEDTEPAPAIPVLDEDPAPAVAVAQLTPREGESISGSVTFTEAVVGVTIAAHVEGVEPGLHGLHVHETGDCSAADFTSAGGHFNPGDVPHGGPDDEVRHAGDLGNIEVGEDGVGHLELASEQLTIGETDYSVVGKAVILHAGEDDLESQPTGAAGGRLACGVVELQE